MEVLENYNKKSVVDEIVNKMEIAVNGFNPYYWESRSVKSLSEVHPYEYWLAYSEDFQNKRFSEFMSHTSP